MKRVLALIGVIALIASCEKKEQEVPVSSVSITQATAEMIIGETIQLSATVSPSNATEKTILWASSKISVATVSNGKVTAVAEGISTITASCGGKSATCQVTVSKGVVAVTSITLNKESVSIIKGESETLVATVKPDDATDKTVTWSSSEAAVASVDNSGKVTAVAGGSAVITANAGDKQATCTVTVTVPVDSITLDRESVTLEEDGTTSLVATVKPDDATDKTVTWSSSDSQIAKVDETGKVMAIKEGEATITATAGEKTASCKVTVNKKVIAAESVSLDKTELSLFEGESAKLAATVKPDNASDKTITWSSGSPEIASVDQEGNVKAIKAGSATITAKASEKQATCQVTVQEKPKVTSITIKTDSFNGYIGKDYPVEVTISPENAQYDLEWTTSDSRVASIQGSGLSVTIHTLDYGKSDIQVKDKISGKSASITVSTVVTDFIWSESTSEKYSGYPLITIEVGEEHQLKYSCTPNSATKLFSDLAQFVFYEPTFVVSTPSCITISEDGVVRGVKEGTVGIKPTGRIIKGSSGSDRIYFKVKPATIQVQSVSLDRETLTLEEGSTATLVATVLPDNASDKKVTWSSSDTQIATVGDNGKVTAIKEGSATITAKAGDKEASCALIVQRKIIAVTAITLNKSELTLEVGQNETLVATVTPDDATDKTVTWTSSDSSVATIEGGKVSAVKEGKATITAKSGDKSAECVVTVEAYDPNCITFADSKVKEKLVAAFDTNHDGKLSYAEAAAVTSADDLKAAFGAIKTYKSFDEFQFFTSIDHLANEMFIGWSLLSSIILPKQIQSIGQTTFKDCVKLSSIVIPNGITEIDYAAFQGCRNLKSITLPERLTVIGINAFRGCTSLASITIPEGSQGIYRNAFSDCTNLTTIDIPISLSYFGDGAFSGCPNLSAITIPENVTTIRPETFLGCSSLSSITLPESMTRIDNDAFNGCSGLCSINIPNALSYIGKNAFYGCSKLSKVNINSLDVWLSLNSSAVYSNPFSASKTGAFYLAGVELTEVTIPESISAIKDNAFCYCNSITKISIPESVSSIGSGAFRECSGLVSINLPESITFIGNAAFVGCSSLTSITIPEGVAALNGTFSRCSNLIAVSLSEGLTSIAEAFVDCTSLSSIVIPESVTMMSAPFKGCTSLSSINIPEGVTDLSSAFMGCTSLNSISIPEGVTDITSAFHGCTSLTTVSLPKSVINMNYAFYTCTSLSSIIIPENVRDMCGSFMACSNLSSVTICDGIQKIDNTFLACTSLTTISIPASVTIIGEKSFFRCRKLSSITLQEGITTIGQFAFSECESLASIILPASVTNISAAAFAGCSYLKSITIKATTPPKAASNSMLYNTNNCVIYVPASSVEAYKTAPYWSDYSSRIQAIQ